MPYWLYEPKRLASTSTLIPYKHQDLGDFLNLLTLGCFMFYIYLFKNNKIERFAKPLLSLMLITLTLGLFSGINVDNNKTTNKNDFLNYENSFRID